MTLPSVALDTVSGLAITQGDSSLSVFAVVQDGYTIAVLGEISKLVSAHFEPDH
jgi:hypothetical protein